MRGHPLDKYMTEEQVKKSIYEHNGQTSAIARDLDITPHGLRKYLHEKNLWPDVYEAQDSQEHEVDDIAMNAVEKLLAKLDNDPSTALKAALATLQRTKGTRKRWAKDDTTKITLDAVQLADLLNSGAIKQK